jgi:hypothetical protein
MLKDLAAKAKQEADDAVNKSTEQLQALLPNASGLRTFIEDLCETVAIVVASKGAQKMVDQLVDAERQLKAAGIDPDQEFPQIHIPGLDPNDPPTEH